MKALRAQDPQAVFVGLGGDKMRAEGCDIRVDYREMAYMGFVAVLQNLDKIQRNFRIAKLSLLNEQPDVLILIDYPSFNLRMAKFCKQHLPNTRIIVDASCCAGVTPERHLAALETMKSCQIKVINE